MIVWKMLRGAGDEAEHIADVVTLPNGKCVVSWPTSTVVYDSEYDARRVHIDHMGGRGEETRFVVAWMPENVERGWTDCYQDRCEGIGLRCVRDGAFHLPAFDYVRGDENREAFMLGYAACASELYGTEWQHEHRLAERGHAKTAESKGEGA